MMKKLGVENMDPESDLVKTLLESYPSRPTPSPEMGRFRGASLQVCQGNQGVGGARCDEHGDFVSGFNGTRRSKRQNRNSKSLG